MKNGRILKWPYLSQKISMDLLLGHFEAFEQTCRLRQLSGSGGKYFLQLAKLIKYTVLVLVLEYVMY